MSEALVKAGSQADLHMQEDKKKKNNMMLYLREDLVDLFRVSLN